MTEPMNGDITREQWQEMERRRVRRTRRALVAILAILVILLLVATVALVSILQPVGKVASSTDQTGMTWVRSIYGWGQTKGEQLQGPQGVGIGPDGVIWATDQGFSRVIGFNPDGSYAGMMFLGVRNDPKSPDAMLYPTSVAVDSDNTIYIGDQAGNNVYVMTRGNKLIRKIPIPSPQAVAVSSDRIVVGAASGFAILPKNGGNPIKVVGTQGKGENQFMAVRGVAIGKDDTIYVVDQYNNRISAYDRNGNRKWIRVMGKAGNQSPVAKNTSGAAAGALQLPAEIAIDGKGRLAVVDPFGFNIAVLDPNNGNIIATYGDAGAQDGQFTYPSGIAYDSARDWFAVADTMNQRVEIIRLPNSGGSALAGINRSLAGPLRACLFPLMLIVLAVIAALIRRALNRRKEAGATSASDASIAPEAAAANEVSQGE
jgi:sugar lactone lactonase YvrE